MLFAKFRNHKSDEEKCVSYFDKYMVNYKKVNKKKEYCELQATWNRSIIKHSFKWLPKERRNVIGIGSYLGLLEFAYSHFVKDVVCVDFDNYLPEFKPKNVSFLKADLDSNEWKLPNELYDVCFMIEILEHLRWSPIPLLKWMNKHARILVISTPDDHEWPAMDSKPWKRHEHFMKIPLATMRSKPNPEPMNHCKQYSLVEFFELLDFCGFRILEFHRVGDGGHQMLAICEPKTK